MIATHVISGLTDHQLLRPRQLLYEARPKKPGLGDVEADKKNLRAEYQPSSVRPLITQTPRMASESCLTGRSYLANL